MRAISLSPQDVSQVEKYMMSDEDYGKRKNTFRAYKQAQIANDPTWKSIFAQRAEAAQVRSRCGVRQRSLRRED
jgi:hypothetical protein